MAKYIIDGYGWQEACNGIKCSECQFRDVEGRCKFGLYISKQPVYEEEKPKEADNTLGITLRKYLHSLSDTDLSLEEIKVALLMGICKQLDLLKKVDVTPKENDGDIVTVPVKCMNCAHCRKPDLICTLFSRKISTEKDMWCSDFVRG